MDSSIVIFEGTVDAAADLETEVPLTAQQQAALAHCILYGGGAVLRVKTGAKTGSPTAILEGIDVSWDGSVWRRAQTISLGEALDNASDEYDGPELYAKVLAMAPTHIRLVWNTETLSGAAYFEDCVVGILLKQAG
jgi:hypothetical protein